MKHPERLVNDGNYGYYGVPHAPVVAADAPGIFAALENSEFVTLYGASNPDDDAAETMAAFVTRQVFGWRLSVEQDGVRIFDGDAQWENALMAEKRAVFDELAQVRYPSMRAQRPADARLGDVVR